MESWHNLDFPRAALASASSTSGQPELTKNISERGLSWTRTSVLCVSMSGLLIQDMLKSHSTLFSSWSVIYGNHMSLQDLYMKRGGCLSRMLPISNLSWLTNTGPSVHTALSYSPPQHWGTMGVLLLLLGQPWTSPLNSEAGKGREATSVGMLKAWPLGKSKEVSRVHTAVSLQWGHQAVGRLQATLAEPSSSVITKHVCLTWQALLPLFS